MHEPWRFWLTGGVAAVLAAASQSSATREKNRASRSSRYSLAETIDRLEREAHKQGLSIFARLQPPARGGTRRRVMADGAVDSQALLLVLGVDAAHTLVLQSTPGAGLDLPLTMRIEQQEGGCTSVEFSDSSWMAECGEMPAELVFQVNALPGLVDAALS